MRIEGERLRTPIENALDGTCAVCNEPLDWDWRDYFTMVARCCGTEYSATVSHVDLRTRSASAEEEKRKKR